MCIYIAKCNIVIDTYLSKEKNNKRDLQDMCKTIRHAVYACSFKYKLRFVLKWTKGTKSIYERDVK